jgi:hypothetical protein
LLSPIKPYLEASYKTYHGMADLYVYFYELGLRLLKPGGLLCFVVTNKWMKASYGEPLRRHFAEQAWVESVVDFGHAKQIFEDADVFPCIIVARRPDERLTPTTTRLCTIPREQLRIDDLSYQIQREGVELPLSQLGAEAWHLEPTGVNELFAKIRDRGVPLSEFAGVKPVTGIKTAFNDAYLIDAATKEELVKSDPNCAPLIRPYVRGSDIGRWHSDWGGVWMITMKSSGDHPWPWAESGVEADEVFRKTYPSLHAHFSKHETALRKRQDQGRFWWELRSCAYWDAFAPGKLFYQLIQFHPCYALDNDGTFGNNKTAFIPTDDLYLLGVLNSPLMWWYTWRFLPHMKDEALAPNPTVLESVSIAQPTDSIRKRTEELVARLVEIAKRQQATRHDLLDWLWVEYEIAKPTMKLQSPTELDSDSFVAEVKKIRGKKKPLSAPALKSLREEYSRSIEPARALAVEALRLENEISCLVNEAYGLTSEEIALMWETAPPRMPIPRPR